jgi:hypothetical protein
VTAIGLLNEKSLHSALKHWYAKPGDLLEFALDGYVVDILRGNHVIEIQTGSFSSIKRKMRDLSCRYRVTLIYPVAHERWILEVPGTLQGSDHATEVAKASGCKSTIRGTRELSRPLEMPELFHRGRFDSRRTVAPLQ